MLSWFPSCECPHVQFLCRSLPLCVWCLSQYSSFTIATKSTLLAATRFSQELRSPLTGSSVTHSLYGNSGWRGRRKSPAREERGTFAGPARIATLFARDHDEDMSDYEEEDEKWIQWFCSLSGNEYFCEVPTSYIEDSFNLYGLRALIPNFQEAMNIILDMTDIPYDDDVPACAAELYGMIHARYIITSHGLDSMMKKYRDRDFGVCPRALCEGQPVVPAGMHDEWKKSEMKVFCPKCRDLYTPVTEYNSPPIDGAYFGTTFPHLFFMTYRELEPPPSTVIYVPRIFGYKIHNRGANRRRLALTALDEEDAQKL